VFRRAASEGYVPPGYNPAAAMLEKPAGHPAEPAGSRSRTQRSCWRRRGPTRRPRKAPGWIPAARHVSADRRPGDRGVRARARRCEPGASDDHLPSKSAAPPEDPRLAPDCPALARARGDPAGVSPGDRIGQRGTARPHRRPRGLEGRRDSLEGAPTHLLAPLDSRPWTAPRSASTP
jgi:hypothetical protein